MTLIFKQKIELEKFLKECESALFAEKSKIEILAEENKKQIIHDLFLQDINFLLYLIAKTL